MSQKDYVLFAAEVALISDVKERKKTALWLAKVFRQFVTSS